MKEARYAYFPVLVLGWYCPINRAVDKTRHSNLKYPGRYLVILSNFLLFCDMSYSTARISINLNVKNDFRVKRNV